MQEQTWDMMQRIEAAAQLPLGEGPRFSHSRHS